MRGGQELTIQFRLELLHRRLDDSTIVVERLQNRDVRYELGFLVCANDIQCWQLFVVNPGKIAARAAPSSSRNVKRSWGAFASRARCCAARWRAILLANISDAQMWTRKRAQAQMGTGEESTRKHRSEKASQLDHFVSHRLARALGQGVSHDRCRRRHDRFCESIASSAR